MICSTQEDERWSDAGYASEETTASETPGGKRDDTSAPGKAQARTMASSMGFIWD
jgi:hypothetical protein